MAINILNFQPVQQSGKYYLQHQISCKYKIPNPKRLHYLAKTEKKLISNDQILSIEVP